MSSNRLIYDNCAYNLRLKDSTGELLYRTYKGAYSNDTKCMKAPNDIDREAMHTRVIIENDLLNLQRLDSKCVADKFAPCYTNPSNPSCQIYQTITPILCDPYREANNLKMPATNGIDNRKY